LHLDYIGEAEMPKLHDIKSANAEVIRTLSESDLRALIRSALAGADTPLSLTEEVSRALQLTLVFRASDPIVRERFRRAVVSCAGEWRRPNDSLGTLQDIAFVAYDIGASEIVPILRVAIERGDIVHHDQQYAAHVLARLITVIGGFGPLPAAENALERFFWDPQISPRHSGQLFLALCRCQPSHYWRYLPKLIDAREADEGLYDLRTLLTQLLEVVGLHTLREGLEQLSASHASSLAKLYRDRLDICIDPPPSELSDAAQHRAWYRRSLLQLQAEPRNYLFRHALANLHTGRAETRH
jgi:hypothetical protein